MKRDPLLDSLLADQPPSNKRWLVHRDDPFAREPNASFSGPLVPDKPSHADVFQGALDDAYLIAALCAVAHVRAEWIFDLIEDAAPYANVRFFHAGERRRADVVRVSSVLSTSPPETRGPTRSSWPLNALGARFWHRQRMVRWGPLVEKGYAQWKGSYAAVVQEPDAGRALSEITGRDVTRIRTAHVDRTTFVRTIERAMRHRQPVVVCLSPRARASSDSRHASDTSESSALEAAGDAAGPSALLSVSRELVERAADGAQETRLFTLRAPRVALLDARHQRSTGVFELVERELVERAAEAFVVRNNAREVTTDPKSWR